MLSRLHDRNICYDFDKADKARKLLVFLFSILNFFFFLEHRTHIESKSLVLFSSERNNIVRNFFASPLRSTFKIFFMFFGYRTVLDIFLPFSQMHVGRCRRGGWGWGWSTPFPDSDNCQHLLVQQRSHFCVFTICGVSCFYNILLLFLAIVVSFFLFYFLRFVGCSVIL